MKEKTKTAEELAYEKIYNEYCEKVKYPQYGKWCKQVVFDTIRSRGISGSREYIIKEVFDPESELYTNTEDGRNVENVLSNINKYFQKNLATEISEEFGDKYFEEYEKLNEEWKDNDFEVCPGYDILMDLKDNADVTDIQLLSRTYDEITYEELKAFIFNLIEK